jgi:hypothetical protein
MGTSTASALQGLSRYKSSLGKTLGYKIYYSLIVLNEQDAHKQSLYEIS